jgi:hypothetical protein
MARNMRCQTTCVSRTRSARTPHRRGCRWDRCGSGVRDETGPDPAGRVCKPAGIGGRHHGTTSRSVWSTRTDLLNGGMQQSRTRYALLLCRECRGLRRHQSVETSIRSYEASWFRTHPKPTVEISLSSATGGSSAEGNENLAGDVARGNYSVRGLLDLACAHAR